MSATPAGIADPAAPLGNPVVIGRQIGTRLTIALDTAIGTTEEIPFEAASGGTIHIPLGSSITTLTFWAAPKRGGTFLALYDKAAAAVVMTVSASKCYELPTAVFGCASLKIVVNAAGNVDLSIKG